MTVTNSDTKLVAIRFGYAFRAVDCFLRHGARGAITEQVVQQGRSGLSFAKLRVGGWLTPSRDDRDHSPVTTSPPALLAISAGTPGSTLSRMNCTEPSPKSTPTLPR